MWPTPHLTQCGALSAAVARSTARARSAQQGPRAESSAALTAKRHSRKLGAKVHHDTLHLTTPDVYTGTCLLRIAESREAKLGDVSDVGDRWYTINTISLCCVICNITAEKYEDDH